MQFLSRLSCNSKIARVNKVRFQCDLSPRYRTGVSNMFETCCNFSATKIASSCRDKNRLCKRAFRLSGSYSSEPSLSQISAKKRERLSSSFLASYLKMPSLTPLLSAQDVSVVLTVFLFTPSLLAEALFLVLPWIEIGFDLTAVHDLGRLYYNACSSRCWLTVTWACCDSRISLH